MKNMITENSVDNMPNGHRQSQQRDVPGLDAAASPPVSSLSLRGKARVGVLLTHHPPSAAMTSADCTTSACRGKMRPVRKSCTSGSESEQQSSTTNRL